MIIVMRILIVQSKEEVVLGRLQQLKLAVNREQSNNEQITPEHTMATYVLKKFNIYNFIE